MSEPILEVKNVSVTLGEEKILLNVNLDVYKSDVIVIVGPSGGGKTVLLKTMAGVYQPQLGSVCFYGKDRKTLSIQGRHELAKKVGVQFQQGGLFDSLTAGENIEFPLFEHGFRDPKFVDQRIEECLGMVGLERARHLLPHEMSGGMRQRLSIARALALKPEILFLDDPTAGLDPINSDKTANLILHLKNEIGATMVVATHDILRAFQMAGRIILVANGEVTETGSKENTLTSTDPRVQQFVNGGLEGPLTPNWD